MVIILTPYVSQLWQVSVGVLNTFQPMRLYWNRF